MKCKIVTKLLLYTMYKDNYTIKERKKLLIEIKKEIQEKNPFVTV